MVWLYVTGSVVAILGLAIWKLVGTLPTDIVGVGMFGFGILIAASMELLGLLLLPLRLLDWLGTNNGEAQRDRRADKAARERAAMRARSAARQVAREQTARDTGEAS